MKRARAAAGYGLRIIEAQRAKGIDQCELARLCGVTQSTVSRWISERTAPPRNRWPALAEALGVNVKLLRWGSLDIPEEGRYRANNAQDSKWYMVPLDQMREVTAEEVEAWKRLPKLPRSG